MQVAHTILEQLGGNRFIAMTGAKNFVGDARSIRFSIPGRLAANKANKVVVELDANDLYTVRFYRLAKLRQDLVGEHELVGAESLRAVFTRATGLDTSL